MKPEDVSIPENWPNLIRRAMLHVASLAYHDIVCSWSRAANSAMQNVRLKAKLDRLETELARKNNRLNLISSRFDRIPAKNRPYYSGIERMEILNHKAACGWNLKQTGKAFLVEPTTISSWMKRIDDDSLVDIPVPWNKYPAYLKYVAQQLKVLVPRFGKKKIAEFFVRSGLHLSATSVGRYLKHNISKKPKLPDPDPIIKDNPGKIVRSKYSNHIWMVDLTTITTCGGFWKAWFPNVISQRWPFCWWVTVIIDHFSRKIIGFAISPKQPSSKEVITVLNRAIRRCKNKPKHIITDKGQQFYPNYAKPENRGKHQFFKWCKKKKIKRRTGAVGKYGSIAIIERFMRSLKDEYTRKIIVPFDQRETGKKISLYIEWYNQYRPHSSLKGRTPQEVYANSPPVKVIEFDKGRKIPKVELQVSYYEGQKHLPVVELRKSA